MLGCSLAVWGVGFRAWGFGVYGLGLRLGSRFSVGLTWAHVVPKRVATAVILPLALRFSTYQPW